MNWAKTLHLNEHTKGSLERENKDGSADYLVLEGSWYFTVERHYGSYYITKVDGYTKGRIPEMLIGMEVLDALKND